MIRENKQLDLSAQCKVVVFNWNTKYPLPNFNDDEKQLSKSKGYDISEHLLDSCTFTKNIANPAGSFSFSLDNSRDWEEFIPNGTWCLIYMSQQNDLDVKSDNMKFYTKNGKRFNKHLRGICYIERVSENVTVEESGAIITSYIVTGADYGIVYDTTEIWADLFRADPLVSELLLKSIEFRNVSNLAFLLDFIHEIFLAPFQLVREAKSRNPKFNIREKDLISSGTQWLMPEALLRTLGIKVSSDGPYYGTIPNLLNMQYTDCEIPIILPLDSINGKLWDRLKSYSIPEFHELFSELDDKGLPKLTFRPIPWGIASLGYEGLRARHAEEAKNRENKNLETSPLMYYEKIKQDNIVIDSIMHIGHNLGTNDQERFNNFFLTFTTTLNTLATAVGIYSGKESAASRVFPYNNRASIRRHGFRKMHVQAESFTSPAKLGQIAQQLKIDKNLNANQYATSVQVLIEYAELMVDYWNEASFFLSGTINIIGDPRIRVGKTIQFKQDAHSKLRGRAFYVEGYSDSFQIAENGVKTWTQTIQVTRGIPIKDLKKLSTQDLSKIKDKIRKKADPTAGAIALASLIRDRKLRDIFLSSIISGRKILSEEDEKLSDRGDYNG